MLAKIEAYLPLLQTHSLPFTLLFMGCFFILFSFFINLIGRNTHFKNLLKFIVNIIRFPIFCLLIAYSAYFSLLLLQSHIYDFNHPLFNVLDNALYITSFLALFWMTFNFLNMSKAKIALWSQKQNHHTINMILPNIQQSISSLLALMMINLIVPLIDIGGRVGFVLDKIAQISLISMVGFLFYQLANIFEKIIITQYITNSTDVYSARKINTQLLILKRFIIVLIFVVTVATILMLFDSFNSIGKGLLTTAGVISAIGAFASQQSLSRIFAGLQIAFTQPVRIGDTVIVDGELGQIEEITLLYIVVKLWDLRRLILPTDYFTSKGLQNLTHDSSQLLGTVYLYTDYTLPVDVVRTKYLELLENSPLWDHKIGALHVTNITEKAMELRALMSADDAAKLWELRCAIREQMIRYIVTTYPGCLSMSRSHTIPANPVTECKIS